jgi:thiol-disulfide isomerase/thioredoxin
MQEKKTNSAFGGQYPKALKNLLMLFCLSCLLFQLGGAQTIDHKDTDVVIPVPKTIDIGALKKLINERHGKILFLNFWATWCEPCTEEFPDIVSLRNSFPDSLLDVVAISVDYPDEAESKVLPFLQAHQVEFPVYIADIKNQDNFINALDTSWSGAVPATFIFDNHGVQKAFLLGQKDLSFFKSEVDTVLKLR